MILYIKDDLKTEFIGNISDISVFHPHFITGLKLLEIVRDIKAESKDPDLRVQLDVFEEQKESDEGQVVCVTCNCNCYCL